MKKIGKTILTFLFVFNIAHCSYGQTGINTDNPEATLHIQLKDDIISQSSISISSEDNSLKFNLFNDGTLKLMDGTNPSVPIDLRTNTDSSIIGVGDTSLDAKTAGGGTLKYSKEDKLLQYSDGVQWKILNYDTPLDYVVASNNYNRVELPNNQNTYLTNWTENYDSTDSFDPSNGQYTVPLTGMYIITFSVHTNRIDQPSRSFFRGQWVKINGSTTTTLVTTQNQYLTSGTYMLGIICSGTVRLNKGDIIAPQVLHNSGNGRILRVDLNGSSVSDRNFNNLSIIRIQQ